MVAKIPSNGVNLTDFTISGTTPFLTIGDAGAEDAGIIFDGNAQDFYIGLDDSTDDLVFGKGSALGTTQAIAIDENMDIAIGPTSDVTITNDGNTDTLTLKSTDADANAGPILNLIRDSGSPADADFIGGIKYTADNDANEATEFAKIDCQIDDASNGTEDGQLFIRGMSAGTLRNRIAVYGSSTVINDDSQAIDFRVESDGNSTMFQVDGTNNAVGVGAVNTSRTFNVTTPSSYAQYAASFVNAASSAPYGLYIQYSAAAPDAGADNYFLYCTDTGTARFYVTGDGDCYNHDDAFNGISDERVKQDITDASSQWDDIKALKIRSFRKKDDVRAYGDDAKTQIGVIAQEALLVSPKLVTEVKPTPADVQSSSEFGTLYEDGDTIPEGKEIGDVKEVKENVKGFKYSILHMKAVKALQEAMAKIEALETSNTDLKNRVTALEG